MDAALSVRRSLDQLQLTGYTDRNLACARGYGRHRLFTAWPDDFNSLRRRWRRQDLHCCILRPVSTARMKLPSRPPAAIELQPDTGANAIRVRGRSDQAHTQARPPDRLWNSIVALAFCEMTDIQPAVMVEIRQRPSPCFPRSQ